MLHSLEYLQATVNFAVLAAHTTQTLTEKEHQLLDESTSPREMQGSALARASHDVSAASASTITHPFEPAQSTFWLFQKHTPCCTLPCYTLHAAHA